VTPEFWRGRRVLLTGHTGFKGAWLGLWLERLGADVGAVALAPDTEPSLYQALSPWPRLDGALGDLRDPAVAVEAVAGAAPEIVFHLAAQALVRRSHAEPAATFETNVSGTVNLLEALRKAPSVKALVVVTSDKVYANHGRGGAFGEDDPLGGADPYSASKACQDLVAAAYDKSFFAAAGVAVGRARAGNVIGGGDWAADRLVPDFVRSMAAGEAVAVRNPDSTRPWQHVLEPLAGYLTYGEALFAGQGAPGALNFGPDAADIRPVRQVVEGLVARWGDGAGWRHDQAEHVAEAGLLTLDAGRAAETIGWRPRLGLDEALDWTVAWYRAAAAGDDMRGFSLDHIAGFEDRIR
jgi:CDP-glucose 4,6-dehydratase